MSSTKTVRSNCLSLIAALAVIGAACTSGNAATAAIEPAEPGAEATEPTAGSEPTAAPQSSAPASSTSEPATPDGTSPTPAPPLPIADGLSPLPPQPAGVDFPTDTWPEGTLGSNVDADELASLMDTALNGDRFGRIEAAVVIDGGQLVFESYGNGFEANEIHDSWSVGKSVAHALLGVLAGEGRLDVMAPAAVPEWQTGDDPRAEITPDMLARMSSGLEWNEGIDVLSIVLGSESQPAAVAQVDKQLADPPDSVFNYSTGSTAVNGRIMGDIVGTGDNFVGWADDVLFAPLGIQSVEMELDLDGNWIAGYGANMTARDFARFGLLYLRDGVWDGTRILPEGWVDYARSPSGTNGSYGSGFWLNRFDDGDFVAEGFRGQKIIVLPEHDLVVVVLANNLSPEPTDTFAGQLVDIFTAE